MRLTEKICTLFIATEGKIKNGKHATKQLLVCHLPRETQINALIKERTTNGWRLERNF